MAFSKVCILYQKENPHQILSCWQLLMLTCSTIRWLFQRGKLNSMLLQSGFQLLSGHFRELWRGRKVLALYISFILFIGFTQHVLICCPKMHHKFRQQMFIKQNQCLQSWLHPSHFPHFTSARRLSAGQRNWLARSCCTRKEREGHWCTPPLQLRSRRNSLNAIIYFPYQAKPTSVVPLIKPGAV